MREDLSKLLLAWYKENGRDLPWRYKGGAHPDPYKVLVSEFMLQQTTVKTVIPYFDRFMKKFPTIFELAKASEEEVFDYWQGLGYYSRARALLQTAQEIVGDRKGNFPQKKEDVLRLKGIGAYTAASFLALAFNKPESVVDGNVMRIICRLFHLTESLDVIKNDIERRAKKIASKTNAADYASAIMDLGALVCTPKKPQCFRCPWQNFCRSKNCENLEGIPQKRRLEKKEKHGFVYIVKNGKGDVFIRKRIEKGLLSGLYELPWSENQILAGAKRTGIEVCHVFTHFSLFLELCVIDGGFSSIDGFFIPYDKLYEYPSSTLMKKVFNKIKENQL